MLVVVPFCAKDAASAHDLLLWCGQLGRQNHPCLLVMDPDVNWKDGQEAVRLAGEAFKSVDATVLDNHAEGWTLGSVLMFTRAALEAQMRCLPWFWLEPDCVPLKPDWLDQLDSAYARCGQPFMGALISHQQPGFPSPYLEGPAVYPANAIELMASSITSEKSWVFSCAPVVVPLAVNTPLIYHFFGLKNEAPTFAERHIPQTMVFGLRNIPPDVVLWHRCKDGSLIRMLRQKRGIRPPRLSTPHRNGVLKVVSLRRAGDIVALLPLLEHKAKRGFQVQLVVATDFMPLLEGVSYVSPIEWKGEWEAPLEAARHHGAINAQVYGKGIPRFGPPSNFVVQAWKNLNSTWNRYLPLDFDQRDYDREERLAETVFKTEKPKLLVKLQGFSSPFQHWEFVWQKLRETFGDAAELVDLDAVKAERLYDLLGLMDRADCLVSADTVTLHLNRWHRIPTVAFINGSQWGSSPRVGNIIARVPYKNTIAQWETVARKIRVAISPIPLDAGTTLVYSHWPLKDPETKRRHESAFSTWPRLGARLVPYAKEDGRNSSVIGDPHAMPFLHDMVAKAFGTGPEQICAVSNNDIWFDERLADAVQSSCRQFGCYWAHRLDGPGGDTDNGVDFVAFTRKWWELHKDLIPDFIFGAIWWDDIITRIMMWSGCPEQSQVYYHEPHVAAMVVRGRQPHMLHAEKLAKEWLNHYNEPHCKPVDLLAHMP